MVRNLASALALAFGLTAASFSIAQASDALFTVTGRIALKDQAKEIGIGEAEIAAIGKTEIDTTILSLGGGSHHVTGILGRSLLQYVDAKGTRLHVVALDGYSIEIPIEDLQKYDVVVATEIDGKTLSVRDKGPAWIIYPVSANKELADLVYEARSVWQILSIDVE